MPTASWCEQRDAFRSFRVDRIRTLDVLDEVFRDEQALADFLRQAKRRPKPPLGATGM